MKKRLLPILTALTLLLTVAVMTSAAFATSSTAYDITNINYIDSFGVCNVTWSDTGDPGGYTVKAYSTDSSTAIYSATVTDPYIFVRLFAADGGTYYVTVTPVNGTTTVTSSNFTYDASKDASYPYVIYSASYDSTTQTMSWNVYGDVYGFRVDAYEYGGTSPVYSAYTTSTSISASEIFPTNGKYYFKIWIVDSTGSNISDSAAWVCVRTGDYEYSGYTTATVIFDANGGFFNDNDDYTQYYAHADSSGTVTFPTNQFKMGQMLEGWYTAAEGGTLVTSSTTFTSDTTLYAHWVTCDHSGSTGRSTCDLMATCSVCGNRIPYSHTMTHIDGVAPTCSEDGTLDCYYCSSCGRYYSSDYGYPNEVLDDLTDPATGNHTYDENNKCTHCGTIGASEDDPYTDTSSGTVRSVLSITATDNSTNSALAGVVNSSSVTSSTVTISRTSQPLTGTLSVGQVVDSSAPGVISVTDSLGSLNLSNATTSGANITAGTVLSGTYTDAISGDVTPMAGEVLFYGDISYSGDTNYKDEEVIKISTFSVALTPTNGGTLDVNTLSVLHYDTSTSTWGALEITDTSTDQTTGQVTVNFQTSSLSPVMVLTAGFNYGTVTVGGVELESGEYLITGSSTIYTGDPKSDATALNTGYAYYTKGNLYLYNYTLSTTSDGISTEESICIVLYEDNYITVTGANGICADGDIDFTADGSLTLTVENTSTVYGIKSGGDITIREATVEVTATVTTGSDGSAYGIYADGDVTIYDGSTVTAEATNTSSSLSYSACGISADGDITITDSSTVSVTTYGYRLSYSINAMGAISITGESEVEAKATTGQAGTSYAIFAYNDAIIISESKVTAYAADGVGGRAIMSYGGNVEISSSEVTVTSISVDGKNTSYGIYAQVNAIITDSEITSTATAAGDGSSAYAIRAEENDISVTGGSVNATATNSGTDGNAYGLRSSNGNVEITDSASIEISATGNGNTYGIYTDGDVSISGSLVVADGGIRVNSGSVSVTAGTSMLEVKAGAAAASATAKAYAPASETLIIPNTTWASGWADYGYVEVALHTHAYDSGVVTTSPTCTSAGVKTYTCGCGYNYTEPVAAAGHNYEAAFTWADDLESATVVLTCSVCQDTVSNNLSVEITEENGVYTASVTYGGVTYTNSINTYTITWQNYNGDTLETDTKVVEGSMPEYNSLNPTRASDNDYSYVFSGWSPAIAAVTGDTTYTATYTTVDHVWSEPVWAWNSDYTATATFTCTDCGHETTVDADVSSVYRLGQRIYTAELTFGGETHKTTQTTGTSLLMIQADYSAVTLAISRANGLDASSYSNFETVTAAIDAVQWGLNVLNQPVVTAYADAINEAIDSLVLADLVEETVEINEPVEGTDTVTEPDDEPEEVEVNDPEPEANPTTGIMISMMAIALAATAAGVSKRR